MNPTPLKGLQVSTPTDTTIVLTRTFNAPRRLVWEAMLTPDKMRRWMLPPPGWITTVCECDARVAGALRVVWKTEEADPAMTLHGVFTDVVLHERAVHTEVMVLGSGQPIGSQVEKHEFAEKGNITTMRITQTYASKEARDGAVASGMDQGMEACYQQLDAVLAQTA
ncbi:MAG: SRPBCC domain-containing protein [Phycisphaerales bacterium]